MDKSKLINHLNKLKKLNKIAEENPLAVARLWDPHCHRWDGFSKLSKRKSGCGKQMQSVGSGMYHCDNCEITEERTSQRQSILGVGSEATLICGGNRAGKTDAAVQFGIATAAGSGEWWVRSWLELNDLPFDLIKEEPQEVWISALSYGDALTYLRPKINKYAPIGVKYSRWKAQDRASVVFDNGGIIRSLSADAGREKFQGGATGLIILDEEHPRAIFDECMLRCVDHNGKILLSMTPLKGITWPHDVFFENPNEGYVASTISGLDNPWISSVKLRRAVSHMSKESQDSRLFGQFTNQQGVVYPEFKRNIHVIEPFTIPDHWPKYRSIDFGVRNPFACIFFALDEKDDVLHVFDEYYATERTTIENGRRLNTMHLDKHFDWTVADPESRDGRLTLARECGIETKTAPKHFGVVETINQVKERLAIDVSGKPHLIVHSNCRNLLKEFRLYKWSTSAAIDKPVKKNDHALDAVRYQVAFLKRYQLHQ